ncbi:hypothetical protein L6164_024085, partial [Bauhinia variegata]
GLPKRRILEYA